MKRKYIVTEGPYGFEIAYVFEEHIAHVDMARKVGASKKDVLGAGFCTFVESEMKFVAWGESVSLDIPARERDEQIINKCLGLIGE